MNTDCQQLVLKLHEDHAYLQALMAQISALCDRGDLTTGCNGCASQQRTSCTSDIENLIRTFIEATLHHNMLESACMQDKAPREHRHAHNQAHLMIAERLKAVRLDFRQTGNGVAAIRDISEIMTLLTEHINSYDEQLEAYLLAA